jgi:hypothetical protein
MHLENARMHGICLMPWAIGLVRCSAAASSGSILLGEIGPHGFMLRCCYFESACIRYSGKYICALTIIAVRSEMVLLDSVPAYPRPTYLPHES